MLKTQASILSEVPGDLFTPDNSDVEGAAIRCMEIVDDDQPDDDIDIMG